MIHTSPSTIIPSTTLLLSPKIIIIIPLYRILPDACFPSAAQKSFSISSGTAGLAVLDIFWARWHKNDSAAAVSFMAKTKETGTRKVLASRKGPAGKRAGLFSKIARNGFISFHKPVGMHADEFIVSEGFLDGINMGEIFFDQDDLGSYVFPLRCPDIL